MAVSLRFALFVVLIGIICGALSTATARRPTCIDSCSGKADGKYHKCDDCRYYVECRGGSKNEVLCPDQKFFDEDEGCVWDSKTCDKTFPIGKCVAKCTPGHYGYFQSCNACNVYVTCDPSGDYQDRPCAEPYLCWDDIKKQCEWTSPTCAECGANPTPSHPPPTTTPSSTPPTTTPSSTPPTTTPSSTPPTTTPSSTPPTTTPISTPPTTTPTTTPPEGCVFSCKGRADGDYQSCDGCHVYVSCCNGNMFDNRICPPGLVWDDYKKGCYWKSATCPCPDDHDHA